MEQAIAVARPYQCPKCLLIEDSDFDQRRIARILACGMQVELTIAKDIEDARAALTGQRFDLILLDNALPDGLGVDFAHEIRDKPGHARVPIVMISDFPSPFMYDKAMAAGVTKVLGKDEFQPKHAHEAMRFARIMARSRQ